MNSIDFCEHPEGGRFREVFRSTATVKTSAGQCRSALTHIYFSLKRGEVSRFHRVAADEVWNFYQGDGIRIFTWDGTHNPPSVTELSERTGEYCHVVPAGFWQAAEPIGDYVLVGCSVGPGFEFEDFEMIEPTSNQAQMIQSISPELSKFAIP